ncbi:PfkB family carbohydrate kinase [Idiomarina abyssalis]|uniref:PfkB family carbohydrate kinase n=1 Tax=Idiomarina abyssalis TaxID=86102 RepID=UPI003A8E41DF
MISIIGGVYRERCMWPTHETYAGSAGRAAMTICHLGEEVSLHSYASPKAQRALMQVCHEKGLKWQGIEVSEDVAFEYDHSLSKPEIYPPLEKMFQRETLSLRAENVLAFGMLECDIKVEADWVVYDPQNLSNPKPFSETGSKANKLAYVLNRHEVLAFTESSSPSTVEGWVELARKIIQKENAAVVVIKLGQSGALVVEPNDFEQVPAFKTESVYLIGSGDVFAAAFAKSLFDGLSPVEAATKASQTTAYYCQEVSYPSKDQREQFVSPLTQHRLSDALEGRVYIAGPFFNIAQLWLIEQAKRFFDSSGLDSFSPYHELGHGPASVVAEKDLDGLKSCNIVFACIDGCDSGTLFELGYATSLGLPIVAYGETVTEEQLKMLEGTGAYIYEDFATALYNVTWQLKDHKS